MASSLHPVQQRILQDAVAGKPDLVASLVRSLGMSRQGIHHHLRALEGEGLLRGTGQTRARRYELVVLAEKELDLDLNSALAEDVVFREHVEPFLDGVPPAPARRCHYAFTEILNNAIDHSAGARVRIGMAWTAAELQLRVSDDGIGIFRKIQQALGLDDPRLSVFELSKGKLTTDPQNHTGEGIFFSSRMAERFRIASGDLEFRADGGELEVLGLTADVQGTEVRMAFDLFSERTPAEVFDEFTATDDDFGFTRTRVVVELARAGSGDLISRSQARRVLERLERFEDVVLDFTGIEMIGQGFADEVFRVFRHRFPAVRITCVREDERVARMIRHVLSGRDDPWLADYESRRREQELRD